MFRLIVYLGYFLVLAVSIKIIIAFLLCFVQRVLLRSAIYSKTLTAILKDLGEWEPCCLSAMVAMVAACVLYVYVYWSPVSQSD